jgi:NAD(P)H dehydrogenase (quinone)
VTIVVTGATGQLGGAVVRHLLDRLPANEIVASVRDPRGARDLGVEVRHGDFDRPETLATAFAGASAVLIVSTPIGSTDRIGQHTAAAHAARDAGAGRIVYTSMAAATTGRNLLAGTHERSEAAIRATGVPYTFLRNNWYLENDLGTVASALATGTIATSTQGGRFAPASYDDLARARRSWRARGTRTPCTSWDPRSRTATRTSPRRSRLRPVGR